MNKRGQFFILAAVIISAVVMSLAVVYNSVYSQPEPTRFYDLSEELKGESARVVDYGVYHDEDVFLLMNNFSKDVARDLSGSYPEIGFVFIYGNKSELHVDNYGDEDSFFQINDSAGVLQGGSENFESSIIINLGSESFSEKVDQDFSDYNKHSWRKKIENPTGENIIVNINKQEYSFLVKENQQFFMILMKKQGDDEYVGIK